MPTLRLSGHSGAGKSRLLWAAKAKGLTFGRLILYTSRPPRPGEADGREYIFRSRDAIEQLPRERFVMFPVHQVLQAVDVDAWVQSMRTGELVVAEVFAAAWPQLRTTLERRMDMPLRVRSVFLTAIDPRWLKGLPTHEAEAKIEKQVRHILTWRGKDNPLDINRRARSAVEEVMEALSGHSPYDRIIYSAPEGPMGEDEWTRTTIPVGRAAEALDEFLDLVNEIAGYQR